MTNQNNSFGYVTAVLLEEDHTMSKRFYAKEYKIKECYFLVW
jgi:hypothetical protein